MKKLLSLLFVVILFVSLVGCAESSNDISENTEEVGTISQRTDNYQHISYTSEKFGYITFNNLPNGYTIDSSDDEVRVSKDQNGYDYISYDTWIRDGDYFRISMDYFYSDDGRQHGEYIQDNEDISGTLTYLQKSSNGHWLIYMADPTTFSVIFGPIEKGIRLVLFPANEDILGYITLTAHYWNHNENADFSDEIYTTLLEDTITIADGISESSLDRNAFNERIYS